MERRKEPMKLSLSAAAVAFAGALALAQESPKAPAGAQAAPGSQEKAKPYEVGAEVDPELSFVDLEGKKHHLKEYLGKIVVLDFWSIQCPVSQGYEARFKKLFADYAKKGVTFLMIDANHGELGARNNLFGKIAGYIKENEIPYPVLVDLNNVVADRFAAQTTPHVFILDAKNKLRYAGGVDDDFAFRKEEKDVKCYVREALDALLAGKEPPQTKTTEHGCSIKRVRASG
jgi:thiol-disulfide isomerase/thioredoxin